MCQLRCDFIRGLRICIRRHYAYGELLIHLKNTVDLAVVAMFLVLLHPLYVGVNISPTLKVKYLLCWKDALIDVSVKIDIEIA